MNVKDYRFEGKVSYRLRTPDFENIMGREPKNDLEWKTFVDCIQDISKECVEDLICSNHEHIKGMVEDDIRFYIQNKQQPKDQLSYESLKAVGNDSKEKESFVFVQLRDYGSMNLKELEQYQQEFVFKTLNDLTQRFMKEFGMEETESVIDICDCIRKLLFWVEDSDDGEEIDFLNAVNDFEGGR